MRSWLLLVVLAGACWRTESARPTSAPPTTAPTAGGETSTSGIRFAAHHTDRCAGVVAHLFEKSRDEIAGGGLSETLIKEMKAMVVASCKETMWSAEALDCYQRTSSSSEITACFTEMPQEQQEDLKRRMNDLFRRQSTSPAPPTP